MAQKHTWKHIERVLLRDIEKKIILKEISRDQNVALNRYCIVKIKIC
jgi:hypothetical protein